MSDLDRRQDNGRSAIFEKLTPEERPAVDVAIVERIPPTFAGVWLDHKLGEKGVSHSAFYRYARRLRDRANLAEIAELTVGDETELSAPIRKLLSRRVLDALLSDEITPDEITRLMAALRQADRSVLQDRALAEKSRIDWARLEHDRDFLRLKLDQLQTMRQRLLGLHVDPADQPRLADSKQDPDPEASKDVAVSQRC